ncbi:mitochondrial carrier domain-containing protein [Lipomyces chichibuensis]|uniref:mitochondrial carrier domain-containing protein n=1 Tax=Lipomyces chichibuensis TaxID=1546026 RepID=UPI003343D152
MATSNPSYTKASIKPSLPSANTQNTQVVQIEVTQVEKISKPWLHFVAGGVGGMMGAIATAPLDVVKTRLQSDFYSSQLMKGHLQQTLHGQKVGHVRSMWLHLYETFQIMANVYRVEGGRSLFKGLGPNLVGVIPARSINFFTYNNGKNLIASSLNNGAEAAWVNLMAAAVAGIVTSTATNPIWLVKTRLQLDKQNSDKGDYTRQYKNSVDCVHQVLKKEGIPGLYRGLTASYLGVVESSLQWVLYEQMKGLINRREKLRNRLGKESTAGDNFFEWLAKSGAAGLAKLSASLLTYPHEVIRTRLRQRPLADGRPQYSGLVNCFMTIWKEEGFVALYGGLTPHLMRTVPNSIIMFGTWELIIKAFS